MIRAITAPPQLRRFVVGLLALLATGAASWIDPPPASDPSSGETKPQPQVAALPPAPSGATTPSPVEVVQWGFASGSSRSRYRASSAAAVPGQPLYLWMTLGGGQAAVDRLRSEGRLAIDVHWTREGAEASAGAPNLVTEVTVGRRGMAPTFAEQVRRQGRFEWHSWVRKDALSRGRWTVSLTYPDGRPVLCVSAPGGSAPGGPCRFSIDVGQPTG